MTETQVEKLMRLLDCTEAEALDIIEKDKIIDKGGRVEFDLDKETEKMAKKFANVKEHKKPTVYKFKQVERKADIPKEELISQVAEFIKSIGCVNVEITNKSKLIEFTMGEDNYKLDLIRKRK